jgi:hypothetical protein
MILRPRSPMPERIVQLLRSGFVRLQDCDMFQGVLTFLLLGGLAQQLSVVKDLALDLLDSALGTFKLYIRIAVEINLSSQILSILSTVCIVISA